MRPFAKRSEDASAATLQISSEEVGGEDVHVFGVRVSATNLGEAVAVVQQAIRERKRIYICVTDANAALVARRNEKLKDVYGDAALSLPDGMPIVWLSRLLGKTRIERVRGTDFMREVTALSSQLGFRNFYFGGAPGTAATLSAKLISSHPGLEAAGVLCPPFRELTAAENLEIVERINSARPDVVWVGLGAPKQERWMATNFGRIEAPVMIGVGAAFDFLAGTKPEAPKWMQRSGLEWLFRLASEPTRLWRRYAVVVPAFLYLGARQVLFHRLLKLQKA
ncbi:WecB/TagA/CpsF family glycosyltransferase [Methylocystis sp. MJC1]|uniref:WecB/TagA/CpsF family glycosyltransferase n=1 Tax=Methylocystis sp. MJC1 TaxID=2654282 RepID=UPI0020A6B73C|nr:WecB/TagA/CpsF family glycosyltransferase [Methylocystis sp. MJC1]UZX11307.1 WecB/TagA/CpsF family glycosyltransferase [Methylocystis sp. MJC1]